MRRRLWGWWCAGRGSVTPAESRRWCRCRELGSGGHGEPVREAVKCGFDEAPACFGLDRRLWSLFARTLPARLPRKDGFPAPSRSLTSHSLHQPDAGACRGCVPRHFNLPRRVLFLPMPLQATSAGHRFVRLYISHIPLFTNFWISATDCGGCRKSTPRNCAASSALGQSKQALGIQPQPNPSLDIGTNAPFVPISELKNTNGPISPTETSTGTRMILTMLGRRTILGTWSVRSVIENRHDNKPVIGRRVS